MAMQGCIASHQEHHPGRPRPCTRDRDPEAAALATTTSAATVFRTSQRVPRVPKPLRSPCEKEFSMNDLNNSGVFSGCAMSVSYQATAHFLSGRHVDVTPKCVTKQQLSGYAMTGLEPSETASARA